MGRPAKPSAVIAAEKKSHRTKAELNARAEAEAAMLTDKPLFERAEVAADKIAHKEFLRISKLMAGIGKNDSIYSNGINVHCQLYSEIRQIESEIRDISSRAEELEKTFDEIEDVTFEQAAAFTRQLTKLIAQKDALRCTIDRKRSMMFAIGKENAMTISSALRVIPKTPPAKTSAILEALNGDDNNG